MVQDTPSRKLDQYIVRFPDGMRDEIKRLAAENGRSMNAQIIELLKFAIENSGTDIDEILGMLSEQRQAMADLRQKLETAPPPPPRKPRISLSDADLEAVLEAVAATLKQSRSPPSPAEE